MQLLSTPQLKRWSVVAALLAAVLLPRHAAHAQPASSPVPDPNSPSGPALQIIEDLVQRGQLGKARELLSQEVKRRGESPQTRYLEGLALFKERKFQESLQALEKGFKLDQEKKYVPIYVLSGLNWVVLDRNDLAEPFLLAAVQLDPKDPMNHYYLGRLYYTLQRFPQAELEFRKTVEMAPSFLKGFDNLALALEALGQDEEAVAAYRKAIDLNEQQKTRSEWPYINLAKFFLDRNRYDESIPVAMHATQANPKSADAFFVLGKAYHKIRADKEALEALERAVQNDANHTETHYLLSRIYFKVGRKEDAEKEMAIFQRLKEMEPKKGGMGTHVSRERKESR
ncbi:MAG: tetratricopeptide repeat protein [Acidobacteriota bacterium]